MKSIFVALLLAGALFLTGCTTFYEVKEPATGRLYYTSELSQMKSGTVKFKDARTGSQVTLQSSELRQIPEEEFKVRKYSDK